MRTSQPITGAILFATCPHDPVASHVLREFLSLLQTEETGSTFAGRIIRRWNSPRLTLLIAETDEVVSHHYAHYLPEMRQHLSGCDFIGIVNWHEGVNAPDKILCLHTTGDVLTGQFGAADSVIFSGLLRALGTEATRSGSGYEALSEATHWSGTNFNGNLSQMSEFSVPVFDLEIGSSPTCWSHPPAHAMLARAIISVADHLCPELPTLLCMGGIHFERSFALPFFDPNLPDFNLAHILPNHWLSLDRYSGDEGAARIANAARSIRGGIHGIVFHDNLKGPFKSALRTAAAQLGVPLFNHKTLRDKARFDAAMLTPFS